MKALILLALFTLASIGAPAAHAQQYPPPTPTAVRGDPAPALAKNAIPRFHGTSTNARDVSAEEVAVGDDALPHTGRNILMLVLWAVTLVVAGGGLVVFARRRLAIAREARESELACPRIGLYDTSGFVPRRAALR